MVFIRRVSNKMNKLKLFFIAIRATLGFVPLMSSVALAADSAGGAVTCGANQKIDISATGGCATVGDSSADAKINSTMTLVIRIFQIVVGLISVIMIIFGGLKYVTSGGEAAGIGSAKNTIIYALIGIVVVVLAQVIVQFVLNRVNTVGTGI
jgi:Type IV secretion system pilin